MYANAVCILPNTSAMDGGICAFEVSVEELSSFPRDALASGEGRRWKIVLAGQTDLNEKCLCAWLFGLVGRIGWHEPSTDEGGR